jgi:branched-chain amino acid transport system substrate-binding protein
VGVLADMNGPYADFSGQGAVVAARLAAEEFGDGGTPPKIEILSADHQNKPDIAVSIAQEWIDTQHVDAVVECSTSGSALALQPLMREKERILLLTVAGSSDITGKACSPFGFHFNCDTDALAHSTGQALTRMGGNSWYFTTVDYAFGHALERDTSRFVTDGAASPGQSYPSIGTADFSKLSCRDAGMGGKGHRFLQRRRGCTKRDQAGGRLWPGPRRPAARRDAAVRHRRAGAGSAGGAGALPFQRLLWDLNEATPAWTKRFRAQKNRLPSMNQAGVYAGVRHYIRAVQAGGRAPKQAAAAMRAAGKRHVQRGRADSRRRARVVADVPCK